MPGADAPPPLTVFMTRKPDGSVVLRCVRADGSATWQRHRRHAAFFPLHDLTHVAVETVLGLERGFFGLVAAGWDLDDFTDPDGLEPLPPEAAAVEVIVGLLDAERADGTRWTARELNEHAASAWQGRGELPPPAVTDGELAAIRAYRGELFARWQATAPGDTLSLTVTPGRGPA